MARTLIINEPSSKQEIVDLAEGGRLRISNFETTSPRVFKTTPRNPLLHHGSCRKPKRNGSCGMTSCYFLVRQYVRVTLKIFEEIRSPAPEQVDPPVSKLESPSSDAKWIDATVYY